MYCGQPHGCSRLANSLDRTAQKLIPEKLKIKDMLYCEDPYIKIEQYEFDQINQRLKNN